MLESYIEIVTLSLYVSLSATILAFLASTSFSLILLLNKFTGRTYILILINSLMGLPPVLVGLFLYLLFSSQGILGFLNMLYTPSIMIIAQFIIITPIIISLSYRSFEERYNEIREYLLSLEASRRKIMYTLIIETRYDLLIIAMTGLGRALSEVGAVILVGGNIANMTRVMTTSIVLETSRGDLDLAIDLGITLVLIGIILNFFVFLIKRKYL